MLILAIAVIIMLIVVLFVGMLFTKFVEEDKNSLSMNFISGILIIFALFQLLSIPATFLRVEFTVLSHIFSALLTGIFLVSLSLNFKRGLSLLNAHLLKVKEISVFKELKSNWALIPLLIMILIFILSNIFGEFGVWADDSYYIGVTLTTIETNRINLYDPYTGKLLADFHWRYVFSPFPIFHAYLSMIFGIHPAVMVRIIVPVIMKCFILCIYFSLGKILFGKSQKLIYIFMFYAFLLITYSGTGLGSPGFFGILYLHMGTALLYVAFLPLCFYVYKRLFSEKTNRGEWVLLISLLFASALVSSMSIILMTMCVGILGMVHLIQTKNIKEVFFMAICCIPNMVFGILFAINTTGWEIYMPA